MSNLAQPVRFTLIVGGVYEIKGKGGKVVRFKFLHANSGKPTLEIDGVQSEVDPIMSLISPEDFQGLYVVDAPTHF